MAITAVVVKSYSNLLNVLQHIATQRKSDLMVRLQNTLFSLGTNSPYSPHIKKRRMAHPDLVEMGS